MQNGDAVGLPSCQTVANYFNGKICTLKRAFAATLRNLGDPGLVCLPDNQFTGPPLTTIATFEPALVFCHHHALIPNGSSLDFVPTGLLKASMGFR
jgi:hypothetical protein